MSLKSLFKSALLGASLLAPLPALANDSAAVMEAGGLRLVRDAPVEILSEVLEIRPDAITVDYVFRAADDMGTTTLVAFPLPEYDLAWYGPELLGQAGDTVAKRLGFRLWIDGMEQSPNLELRALRNGIDVTQYLEGYGIPIGSLDYDAVMQSLRALPQEMKDWMAAADLVRWNGNYDPEPRWTIRATYFWSQTFPPFRDVRVRHTYTPVVGGFILTDPKLREFTPADYCMSDGEKNAVSKKISTTQYGAIVTTQVRYVLTTGANWRGPIQDFTLIIDKASTDALVSLCFDGLKKTAPTRFESHKRNFTPTRELDVLFFNAAMP